MYCGLFLSQRRGDSEVSKNELALKEALEDLVKFAEDNPTKIEEFFERVKEIKEQMYQDFEVIRNKCYRE